MRDKSGSTPGPQTPVEQHIAGSKISNSFILSPPELHKYMLILISQNTPEDAKFSWLFFYSPVSAKCLILPPISSRTRSNSVHSFPAGSSKPQCSRFTCGG